MSKCMTLADETIGQKDTCKEIDAKDIVEFILEEALISAVNFSDKGCNRIGDFNITEDFCQQFDERPANSKNLEIDKIKPEQDSASNDVNFNSGEIVDHFVSSVTAKENLELILDSLPKKDEKFKNVNECKVITEETLADNELRIENGQIHIERNITQNTKLSFSNEGRSEFYEREDVIKDEKIEIEYFNDGKLNKIYVPLSKASLTESDISAPLCEQETPGNDAKENEGSTQRPFAPFSTEELRQVWGNANSSIVGGWDGDMTTQPEEVVRLMEELSSVQVFSDSSVDPNRPRTCAFGEEDVKKMIKEIEEINFNQSHNTLEDLDLAYHPDGQGDADLDTKSLVLKSKDSIVKSFKLHKDQEESSPSDNLQSKSCTYQSTDDLENSLMNEKKNEEILLSTQSYLKLTEVDKETNGVKEKQPHSTHKDKEKLGKPPFPNPDAEEYLIESGSPSDKSILINHSKNERSVPSSKSLSSKKSSHNLTLTHVSEKETDQESQRIYTEKSLYSTEQNEQNALDGSSLEEKGGNVMVSRLNSKEEIKKEYTELRRKKGETLSPNPCIDNLFLDSGHFSKLPQSSKMNLRKSLKASDISLKDSKLLAESNVCNVNDSESVNDSTEDASFSPILLYNECTKNPKTSCDDAEDATLFSQDSKLFPEKVLQESGTKENPHIFSMNLSLENENGDLKRLESRSNKISERVPGVDSFTVEREIKVPIWNANLLYRVDRETDDLEIVTSENHSPSTDLSMEKLNHYFGASTAIDNVNRDSNHSVSKAYLTEENQNVKEAKSDEQRDDDAMDVETNSGDKDFEKEHTGQEEEDNPPNTSDSLEHTSYNEASSSIAHQTFKLHSQKMYLGSDLEPTNFESNEFILTDSEEAFIDSTENVIQVIEPHESTNDEVSYAISFSLLNESSDKQPYPLQTDRASTSDFSLSSNYERTLSENENILTRNVFSGMTTIGPMKNLDLDPKDLSGPEIDFGKMTRISSSRQLAKDIFGMEIKSVSSRKIPEEQESDGESSMAMDGDRLEIGSLINRDIASLTKVQKVKEVMSYHPKADEDFEDDDTLTRPRLDLKDVESMTDERYKITDVNIPLLSFEVGDSNSETDKEYIQGIQLVLSGNCFSNNPYYEDEFDADNIQTDRNRSVVNTECEKYFSDDIKMSNEDVSEFVSIKETRKESENSVNIKVKSKTSSLSRDLSLTKNNSQEQANDKDSQDDCTIGHCKYGTLGSVFKKASGKLIGKEGDLFLRNSKSLPRDPSRINATDSIRSILEDCHSSATNVLKKSHSLLKNTQSIFKTMSQNRFGGHSSSTNLNKHKMTSSESETNARTTLERKPSTFQWKEDFSKAKTLIKNKVEKTLKSLDRSSSQGSKTEISSESKDLRLAVRNEENYRVDRVENFRKLLPKSPLIYKCQFVRSQMSVQSNVQEDFNSVSTCDKPISKQRDTEKNSKVLLNENGSEKIYNEESGSSKNEGIPERQDSEIELVSSNKGKTSGEELTWTVEKREQGELHKNPTRDCEPQEPEYIVMETVQGLPTVDLENSFYETNHQKDKMASNIESVGKTGGSKDVSERYQMEISNYSQYIPTCCTPSVSDLEEDKNNMNTPSEKKIRTKNKKFTARFRSFLSSAFGKVKTSSKNKDPS